MRRTPAVILTEKNRPPILDEIEVHDPQAGEVLVALRASGICHTDLAAVRDARSYPIVLGHEGAGVVEAVGLGVTHVVPGDHVIINWQPKCGHCARCQADRSDLCENVTGTAGPRVFWRGEPIAVLLQSGTFCAFVVVPAAGAVKVRRDLAFAEAALIGCGVATGVGAALFTAKMQPGDTAAVIGTGGVGLNIVQGARLAGASRIVAVDIDDGQLALARTFGATDTVNARDPDLVEKVRAVSGGRGLDFVFEVVGLPALMRTGVDMLARGGELVLVGAAARDAEFSFAPRRFMSCQQVVRGSIYGNIRPARHLPLLADWCCEGRIDVKRLITQTVRLEDVPRLFAEPERLRGIRTVIEWPSPAAH
ncbi:MAG: zinc-binding dehydrogenase [Opitutaceae bacterium]|nr:zinc-binding dehydrogenase [Opitutaceae bacterium]